MQISTSSKISSGMLFLILSRARAQVCALMGRSYLTTEKHTANQRMGPAVIRPVM